MKIEIFPDATTVAQEAAAFIAAEARAAVAERGRFIMAVSGGKTPWIMLKALAQEEIPWEHVHIFQVDERIAPAGSADRNLTHLRESLCSNAAVRSEQIYGMPVEESDSLAAAKKYVDLLRSIAGSEGVLKMNKIDEVPGARSTAEECISHTRRGEHRSDAVIRDFRLFEDTLSPIVFDLVHLGLGPDGHTASLIPEDPVLKVIDRDLALTGVYQGHNRMTLTYPSLNRARRVLWVVTGEEKTTALTHLLNRDACIPGGLVEQEHATLFADRAAAGDLDFSLWKKNSWNVGIASDHGGFELKKELIARLQFQGYHVTDFGAPSLAPEDDYPDYAIPLARAVAEKKVDRGIAICGSGVGVAVCVNKIKGVRAALIHDHFSAQQGVEDDHINMICLGGRTIGLEVAWDLVQTYLHSNYSHAERHLRRLAKVAALEG